MPAAPPSPPTEPLRRKSFLARLSPPQLIALSFAVAILIGGTLLSLPVTHGVNPDGTLRPVNFLQALFTATSALCVTGLNVIDPSKDFNRLGQVIIMLLIQVGGLGIITFGTSFALVMRRRVAYSERIRVAQQVSALSAGDVTRLIRNIFLYTFAIELVGAAVLAFKFVPMHGWGMGLFYAVFHSISAFNNAGFALYSDNLMGFVGDPLVSGIGSTLIELLGAERVRIHPAVSSVALASPAPTCCLPVQTAQQGTCQRPVHKLARPCTADAQ